VISCSRCARSSVATAPWGISFRAWAAPRWMRLLSKRELVLDGNRIPTTHDILRYYDAERFMSVANAAVSLHDPAVHCELLETLDKIVHAPNTVAALEPFFNMHDLTIQYYTLWRMENLLDGQPVHLANGDLEVVLRMLRDHPRDC